MATDAHDRVAVFKGIAIAWIASAFFYVVGVLAVEEFRLFLDWRAEKVFALSVLPPTFSLIAGIGWAAKTRHFESNIDGAKPESGSSLDITLRYNQNTMEQLILFWMACFALFVASPLVAKAFLPVASAWFVIARCAFFVGYKTDPLHRAFGFAATFHPTIILLLAALWFLISA